MARKVIYWVTTVLVALMSVFAGFAYLSGSSQAVQGFAHVGYHSTCASFSVSQRFWAAIALVAPAFPT